MALGSALTIHEATEVISQAWDVNLLVKCRLICGGLALVLKTIENIMLHYAFMLFNMFTPNPCNEERLPPFHFH